MADEETPKEETEEKVEAAAEETPAVEAKEEAPAATEEAAPATSEEPKEKEKPRTAEDIFLELEGAEGAEAPKILKAKGSKNIHSGVERPEHNPFYTPDDD